MGIQQHPVIAILKLSIKVKAVKGHRCKVYDAVKQKRAKSHWLTKPCAWHEASCHCYSYYNNSCYNYYNKTEDQRTASVHCLVIPVQDMWPGRHYDSHCQGVLGRCLIATGQYLETEAANVALTMCKEIDDRLHGRSSHSCLLRLYMS